MLNAFVTLFGAAGATVGIIAMLVLFIVYSAAVNGYVLSSLWGWFIVPVFAVEPITIVQAVGLSIVVSFVTFHGTPKDYKPDWTQALLRPFVVLLMGWIVRTFFM
jgi:hypothetical protein